MNALHMSTFRSLSQCHYFVFPFPTRSELNLISLRHIPIHHTNRKLIIRSCAPSTAPTLTLHAPTHEPAYPALLKSSGNDHPHTPNLHTSRPRRPRHKSKCVHLSPQQRCSLCSNSPPHGRGKGTPYLYPALARCSAQNTTSTGCGFGGCDSHPPRYTAASAFTSGRCVLH
jgi:hypothetical protein